MNDKEKADCYLELRKVQMDHLRQTRDIEFKVNIAIWTAIVLAGYFLYGKVHLNNCLYWLGYIAISALIYSGHLFLWMVPIQYSEDQDVYFIKEYRCRVEARVLLDNTECVIFSFCDPVVQECGDREDLPSAAVPQAAAGYAASRVAQAADAEPGGDFGGSASTPGKSPRKTAQRPEGQWSIRINDQWRICFEWRDGVACNVEIVDYH